MKHLPWAGILVAATAILMIATGGVALDLGQWLWIATLAVSAVNCGVDLRRWVERAPDGIFETRRRGLG